MQKGEFLPKSFFTQTDVVAIARQLLGKVLVTCIDKELTAGKIVEVEAYRAPEDKACHAWNNRRTPRTETMFGEGGQAYVYLCYGIHHLFNVVTGPQGMAHAVLIRGLEPLENVELMLKRRKLVRPYPKMTAGPGALAQALGITTVLNGSDLRSTDGSRVWLEDRGFETAPDWIRSGPRIGVESAGECAHWPWRFWIAGSAWVSKNDGLRKG